MGNWGDRHPVKQALRQQIWQRLQQAKASIGNPVGHIPNFVGAEAACDRLSQQEIWQRAKVIKCNPDSPQRPVRQRALEQGKTLYMAVPQLRQAQCFVELTAEALAAQGKSPQDGADKQNALHYGKPVDFAAMQPIDLVLVGCVAVSEQGGRLGKGAGFADLELALLSQCDLVSAQTPIATTIHEQQWVAHEQLPMQAHDWPLDWIITPQRSLAISSPWPRPSNLDWQQLQPDQLTQIPILQQLQIGTAP